ncbi:hypothetical protein [Acinetobacter sp.]|uniref:hypothetical protein n=1 Tax=Acinetobacter sp. TaxID=472 RepID=UPI003CFDC80F
MNQTPSHSQTPEFGHIPQTGILYQQPPCTKQISQVNRRNKRNAFLKEFFAIFLIGITVVSTTATVRSCSNDADRRAVEAVKFQMEVSK